MTEPDITPPVPQPEKEIPVQHASTPPARPSIRTLEGLEHLTHQFLLAEATRLAAEGKYEEAEARLAAIQDGRKHAPVLDLLARIRAQQGRPAEAVEFWQMAVQMDPANAEYRAGLAYVEKAARGPFHPNRLPGLLLRLLGGLLLLGLLIAVLVRLGGLERRLSNLSQPAAAQSVDLTGIEDRLAGLESNLSGIQTGIQDAQTDLAGLQAKMEEGQTSSSAALLEIEGRLTALDDGQQALLASQAVDVQPLDLALDVPGFSLQAGEGEWIITPENGLFRYGWLMDEEARAGLIEVARQLSPLVGQVQVDLIGYTADDEQDPNFDLAMIRAVLAADVLREAGMPAGMISILPADGRPAPFANDSPDHRAANRTVILRLRR